uniref:GH16 domain-containing protein n=1 Tax=Panagrolaimus sp. ES5 TaxID=591445 RepID=A0AC34FV17_9BILA
MKNIFLKIFLVCCFLLAGISAYQHQKTYEGDSFFDGFWFWDQPDPTHGFVNYVNKENAQNMKLTGVRISADSSNKVGDDKGRPSIRIHSNDKYNEGLFIFDIDHMPTGPGTWPAFWLSSKDWPNGGEIDILEGVNDQKTNNMALHTTANCVIPESTDPFKGQWAKGPEGKISNDCNHEAGGQFPNQGCSITTEDGYFGPDFNGGGGGVFAMEWNRESFIKIWVFKRNEVPGDLKDNPQPQNWGKPWAHFTIGEQCSTDHFRDQEIIINLTFCGDWAGDTFDGKKPACEDKVRNDPEAYKEAFWLINSLKVYSP